MQIMASDVRGEMTAGAKPFAFWVSIIPSASALLVLFQILWWKIVMTHDSSRASFLKGVVSFIVGAVVFLVIGLAMITETIEKRVDVSRDSLVATLLIGDGALPCPR